MKKTFTILHTNDLHSSFIGMGPAADYTPFTLNDDATRGGYARLAGLITKRKEARKDQGPVLVLDAGDYSMGTPFGAATREISAELQLMALMGYDATTFGNHEFIDRKNYNSRFANNCKHRQKNCEKPTICP